MGWGGYLVSADYWSRITQDWQSKLLAVASWPSCLFTSGSTAHRDRSLSVRPLSTRLPTGR
ncbi:hypothetical protein [Streptomyces yanii]|uniref:Uncharacterized protein n=1 Tax=Streptomyces yanii TaxID=78510 RepID=A0ABV5R1K7_9ACTN